MYQLTPYKIFAHTVRDDINGDTCSRSTVSIASVFKLVAQKRMHAVCRERLKMMIWIVGIARSEHSDDRLGRPGTVRPANQMQTCYGMRLLIPSAVPI